MQTETMEYQADGLRMVGHLALPGNEGAGERRKPAVLVYPQAFGIGPHVKEVAERLAGLGYVAFACDLHGDAKLAPTLEEALALLAPVRSNAARTRSRAEGARAALVSRPEVDASRVAAIGFCFGGTMALELGRSGADLVAIAGFHSGLQTIDRQDAKNIKGKVLVCIGADDPSIDADQRAAFEQEMKAGGVNWQMSVYGGVKHSFTNKKAALAGRPDFAVYDEQADQRSWNEMLGMFQEVF